MPKMDDRELRALLSAGARKPLPPYEWLHQVFAYDAETGVLSWKSRANERKEWNTRWAGKPAGTSCGNGACLAVRAKPYGSLKVHRIAWKMTYGDEPHEIDHVDCDPFNNRIANLRVASRSDNQANVAGWSKSGMKGAYFDQRRGKWYSRISKLGRDKFLGFFDTPDEAHEAYTRAAHDLYRQFARTGHQQESAQCPG